MTDADRISTWTTMGWVIHRRDLTDLGEPYLTLVKEARAAKTTRAHNAGVLLNGALEAPE